MLVAMSTPSEPMILAEQGPLVIAELVPQVLVIDRGRVPTEMTVLVLTMMTLIFGGFGVVSMFYGSARLAVGIGAFRAMPPRARPYAPSPSGTRVLKLTNLFGGGDRHTGLCADYAVHRV